MAPSTRAHLRDLAEQVGSQVGDLNDEHERWRLYKLAMDTPAAVPSLFDCLALERDPAVQSAAVVMMIERIESDQRGRWVDLLPREHMEFARTRMRELAKLDELRSGNYSAERIAREVANWSNWLQFGAVKYASDETVLNVLAENGRTKRIRNMAVQKSRHRSDL
ncbi:hypothetical protein [Sphaerisporangium aureirubrum]|uniref:HEAT repeat domain-containing protein n=1 Tax=Sphaerisporangium aureirubrum TaxID=1544736 RepID=A0ABW1NE13_9ACTN